MSRQTHRDATISMKYGIEFTSVEHRRLYNSKAPISKLDHDVLSYIFMINTQLDFEHPHIPSITTRLSSQVIKKWRDLALDYSTLWAASLDFADPLPWIHEVLSRASTSPIDLIFPPISWGAAVGDKEIRSRYRLIRPSLFSHTSARVWDSPDKKFSLALSLSHKAQHFAMNVSPARWIHMLKDLTRASPNLQTFTLFLHSQGTLFSNSEDHDYILPANIFDGQAPLLRTLNIDRCRCHFLSPIFRNLTALSVTNLYSPRAHTAKEWIEILSGMPELVKLDLEQCFRQDLIQTEGPATHPSVFLPKLQTIVLHGNYIPCGLVFTHLQFPLSCEMDIKCLETEADGHYHSMVNDVQRKLKALSLIRWKTEGILAVKCTSEGLGFSNVHHALETRIFSFNWDHNSYYDLRGMFPSFLATTHVAFLDFKLTDVHLDLDLATFPHVAELEVLHLFDKVENLRVSTNDALKHILLMLNKANATDTALLPALTKLSCYRINFGESYSRVPCSSLVDLLYQRSDIGMPIEIIRFTDCTGVIEPISELEILGVKVEWDGKDHDVPKLR